MESSPLLKTSRIKYSGCGNTFVLADNREEKGRYDPFSICKEEQVDGLILFENSSIADAKMRIFNQDGTEAEMCGNGIRCFTAFLHSLGIKKENYRIETKAGILTTRFVDDEIAVDMGKPTDFREFSTYSFVNTGVPHAIFFVNDLENDPLVEKALELRDHPDFSPDGANINLAKVNDQDTIALRTFERGLFTESMACGTGASAVAFAAYKTGGFSSTIRLETRLNHTLTVTIQSDGTLELKGKAELLN